MDSTLRIVPSTQPGSSKGASVRDTANSLGTHDTLRYGQRNLESEAKAGGGLQHRLDGWEETQDNLKLTLQRNMYGIHAPVRLLMERKIVGFNPHMPALPTSNLSLDILMGRDETLDVADFFGGMIAKQSFR
ncbi:hypothetical protein FRC02_001676 [Tulasnella sp. 418]|nr:hypothetical protein FRC02_001676 [Tulasnella sp. 418]